MTDVEMPKVVVTSPSLPLPGTGQTERRDVTAVLSTFDIPHCEHRSFKQCFNQGRWCSNCMVFFVLVSGQRLVRFDKFQLGFDGMTWYCSPQYRVTSQVWDYISLTLFW